MRICYITNLYPPEVLGGAEIIVQKMARAMSKKGHDITVITTGVDGEQVSYDDKIKVHRLNTTRLYRPYRQTNVSGIKKPLWHLFDLYNNKTKNRVEEILREEDVDIIHINNYKGLSMAVFETGKDLNIPVVFESHDFSLICPRANLIRSDNTLCLKRNYICDMYVKIQRKLLDDNIDLLVSPSDFMINKYRENNFFKDTESVKIPLATDKKTVRKEKTYDVIDITYIGSVGKHKGVDILIDAFKQIDNENIRLHIVGKGYDEDEFRKQASDDERIIFHGFVDNSKITDFYDEANIVVIPSICYDNSPMVIYESFSRSTPVVGSNIGGIPELIDDEVNGLLFDTGSSVSLRQKLLKLINNKTLLKKLEDNASGTLPENSMDLMIDRLETEYEKLLE